VQLRTDDGILQAAGAIAFFFAATDGVAVTLTAANARLAANTHFEMVWIMEAPASVRYGIKDCISAVGSQASAPAVQRDIVLLFGAAMPQMSAALGDRRSKFYVAGLFLLIVAARQRSGAVAMAAPSTEDRFAIEDLFIRYTMAMDDGDVEGVVACFVEDCVLESNVIGRHEGIAGVRRLAVQMAKLKHDGRAYRHVISNFRIAVDGDRAHARCYLLDYLTMNGKIELVSPGEYECDLVRSGRGWLFARRRVQTDRQFSLPGLPKAKQPAARKPAKKRLAKIKARPARKRASAS
jgi:3-phenylpropionate/cinnamic acid dioxygenase small subunit